MLPRENHLFGCTRSKPSQGSVPTDLTLASDFSLCFHCKGGSSLVLRRPIETTALIPDFAIFRLATTRSIMALRSHLNYSVLLGRPAIITPVEREAMLVRLSET